MSQLKDEEVFDCDDDVVVVGDVVEAAVYDEFCA